MHKFVIHFYVPLNVKLTCHEQCREDGQTEVTLQESIFQNVIYSYTCVLFNCFTIRSGILGILNRLDEYRNSVCGLHMLFPIRVIFFSRTHVVKESSFFTSRRELKIWQFFFKKIFDMTYRQLIVSLFQDKYICFMSSAHLSIPSAHDLIWQVFEDLELL